ncbi:MULTISPECIES: phosphate regulon sensor histidine kinase PhoR [Caldimonas]|uniref:phosphate regulon sensor histidine kinase PhoR n=1 Tax=Caldimonas TaxID=196013 RepID=UPI000381B824|nr:phosphate regulon sensor histidine kinase PhoR [Caldimonas manganoxidans]MCX7660518.1 phosphate regulon sensor histidine kinase PhoR [Caldimonas manganoxidans]GIX25064.1 MAG: phosphate regulon sensor histidine kinase PhoR [Caldimonas sp.]
MNWLFPRAFAGIAVVLAGAVAGYGVGRMLESALLMGLLGACGAAAMLILLDTLRGHRLLRWLREDQQGAAPRDAGLWGELGYRIERALRKREQQVQHEQTRLTQFLSAIEASPNGVMMLDAEDHIQWCNRVAAEHFGLDPQRDLQQRVTNLVRAPAFVAYLQEGEFKGSIQFPGARAGVSLSVTVRPYGEGMKLVLSQDITERERAERMRRDFVANVSHEIRTPLTVLAGFIETLTNLPLTDAERTRVLGLMAQQTERMQTLVSDLLTLARLEGGPRPPTDVWCDVGRLMLQAEQDAHNLSRGRHHLSFRVEQPARVAGVESEYFSALSNLVSNAIRYTPEGGSIDVVWRVRADGSGEFLVQDTGIGIDKEHLPRLAERFYRVDGSRSRETGGTGLGLSIVKHVMQRHGGELDMRSEPGKGSQFRLIVPPLRVAPVAPAQDDVMASPVAAPSA